MIHCYNRTFTMACTVLFIASLSAQQIFIPDVELRAVYNTWVPGCVDGDGVLDGSLQEVQAYNGNAHFNSTPVAQLNGLGAFTSLQNLYFTGLGDTVSIDALPPNLETLEVSGAQVTALPGLPATLKSLKIHAYLMVQLPPLPEGLLTLELIGDYGVTPLPAWPSSLLHLVLRYLPDSSELPAFPVGLKSLNVDYGGYSYPLPEIAGTELERLSITDMVYDQSLGEFPQSLRSIRLHNCNELVDVPSFPEGMDSILIIDAYSLTDLPDLPDSLEVLSLQVCPIQALSALPEGLRELTCLDLSIQELPALPSTLRGLYLDMLPINCLPILPDSLEWLFLQLTDVGCMPNAPLNCDMNSQAAMLELCSVMNTICPAQNPGIGGRVFHDVNGNGVLDSDEPGCNYVSLLVEPLGYAGGVPLSGQYDLGLDPGDYSISCVPYMPFVQSVAPMSHSASLPTQTSYDSDNDFALTIPVFQDVSLALTAWPYCPGFDRPLWITVTNQGTLMSDLSVELTFDIDQGFVQSWPPPAAQNGNTLQWAVDDLAMGEQRSILVMLHTDMSVPLGTGISHLATTGAMPNDDQPENNVALLETTIVGSYDPNDKTVTPSVIEASEQATSEFTYTIRFQNTGTYHAERVVITDTLSASLDWTSFRFIASSHTCNWTLYNGVLRFTFEPIYLPDSTSDEPASHGFVTFSMKPDVTAGLGPIGNVANIYFDYNAPVITNEAVVDISTGTPMPERTGVRLFPIPAQELLWIQRATSGTALASVIDAQGRTLLTRGVNGTTARLEVGELPPGAYVLELRSDSIERIPFLKQ